MYKPNNPHNVSASIITIVCSAIYEQKLHMTKQYECIIAKKIWFMNIKFQFKLKEMWSWIIAKSAPQLMCILLLFLALATERLFKCLLEVTLLL